MPSSLAAPAGVGDHQKNSLTGTDYGVDADLDEMVDATGRLRQRGTHLSLRASAAHSLGFGIAPPGEGRIQRVIALDCFLQDIRGQARILHDRIGPAAPPRTRSLPRVRGIAVFYEIARTAPGQGAASDFLALGQAVEGMENLAAASALERLGRQSAYALSPASDAAFALGAAPASLEKAPEERPSYLLVELPVGCNRLHQQIEKALGRPGGNAG